MSDPASNVEIEDVLASVRRLVSSERQDRAAPPDKVLPEPTKPAEALVLTADFRVGGATTPPRSDRQPSGAGRSAVSPDRPGTPGRDEAEPAPAVQAPVEDADSRSTTEPSGDGEGIAGITDEPRLLTLEERIAQLEAAVQAHAAAEFEPDGSEDLTQHRPDSIPGLAPLDRKATGTADLNARFAEAADSADADADAEPDSQEVDAIAAMAAEIALELSETSGRTEEFTLSFRSAAFAREIGPDPVQDASAQTLGGDADPAQDAAEASLEVGPEPVQDEADTAQDAGSELAEASPGFGSDAADVDEGVTADASLEKDAAQAAPADAFQPQQLPTGDEDQRADAALSFEAALNKALEEEGSQFDDTATERAATADASDLTDKSEPRSGPAEPGPSVADPADAPQAFEAEETADGRTTEAIDDTIESEDFLAAASEEIDFDAWEEIYAGAADTARAPEVSGDAEAADPDAGARYLRDRPKPSLVQPPDGPGAAADLHVAGSGTGESDWDDRLHDLETDDEIGGIDFTDDAQEIDEETLRDMISEIVREELQGALGERITRNVRKLVRREIMRAMSIRDFE